MGLSHEHVGSKIPAKIQLYILTRAELLITLCYDIPCKTNLMKMSRQVANGTKGNPYQVVN